MKRRTFAQSLLALSAAPLLAHPTNASAAAELYSQRLMGGSITEVPGIKVGQHILTRRPIGCTVILCEDGAMGGVDVRGSAPVPVKPTCSTRPMPSSGSKPPYCPAAAPTVWRLPPA